MLSTSRHMNTKIISPQCKPNRVILYIQVKPCAIVLGFANNNASLSFMTSSLAVPNVGTDGGEGGI